MDAFETARQEAARLHAEAVGAGADPWRPLALVEAAIEGEEVDLSWLGRGDPMLRGGLGLFDPHLGAILCDDAGDDGERALLAAHELGHAVLHDPGEAVVDRHVDPARAAEGAASGIEKVADYGRRERREVQADLFARELVLPRFRARALFADGLGAADVAARARLPYPLVAQQMLDAVLLPEPEPRDPARARADVPLDDSQRAAAEHAGSPLLLQAGPGTGKTRTLVARVERLVEAGADPSSILVLTFSNRAAGELVERLGEARPDVAAAAWVGTFHGFGLDLLRRFHGKEGLSDDPRLVDRADAVGLLEDLVPRLPLRHYRNLHDPTLNLGDVLGGISRAKDELADPARYRALALAMDAAAGGDPDAGLAAGKALEVADVYDAYDTALRREGLLDFGDLVMRPALLLERDEEARAWVRERHRHVLVDEYQDVNRASVRLLKALVGEGERLWVVGDSRQSVYRFRGASSANMAGFLDDFPGGTLARLRVNYRSSREVVDAFSRFADGMIASRGVLPLDLAAAAGPAGEAPELRRVEHPDDEAAAVAARIVALRDAGVRYRDQAVLCRGNKRLADVAAALERRDIPVLFLGNLFEREEVRDLLALLSLVVDPKASGLPRVATMPRYAMGLDELGRFRGALAASERPLGWLDAAAAEGGTATAPALAALREDLGGLGVDGHPWDVLCRLLLDRDGPLRELVASPRPRDRLRAVALWQFMLFCRSLPGGAGLPIQRLLDRVRRLVLLSEERDLRQVPGAAATADAVRLMTVHGSKGLEFEAVHVPGMVVTGFPGRHQPPRCPPPDGLVAGSDGMTGLATVRAGHEEEEQCLFFVALSRARRHLSLYAASTQANGNRREPSPFLAAVGPGLVVPAAPGLLLPDREDPTAHRVHVDWPAEPAVTAEQMSLYLQCPRRFFYTHVLRVAGGRRSTAFARMHDVVHEVLRWLRADPGRWDAPADLVEAIYAESWSAMGPTDHGYAEDYRRVGLDLVRTFLRYRSGHRPMAREAVDLPVGGLRLVVEPDEVRGDAGGAVLRRVRTGRRSSDEGDDIVYGLYALAARRRYGGDARVEAIHLSEGDDPVAPVELTERKIRNREVKASRAAADILAGEFPPDPNERRCPRCPHYFVCAAVPAGRLPA